MRSWRSNATGLVCLYSVQGARYKSFEGEQRSDMEMSATSRSLACLQCMYVRRCKRFEGDPRSVLKIVVGDKVS